MTSPSRLSHAAIYTGLVIGGLITLVPFALGLLTSFTSARQFATGTPLQLPRPFTLSNYGDLAGAGFGRAAMVTALMTAVILLGQLTFSVLAAYAFARLEFPGRDAHVLGLHRDVDGARDRHRGAAVSDDGPAGSAQHLLGVGAAVHVRLPLRDFPAARALSD